jgi:hypothetical protein
MTILFFVPIWVLVSIVRSKIRCFSHILPAFLLLILLSPILLSSYYSFVFLLLFLCTAIGCVVVRVLHCKTDSPGPGFLPFCYCVWPTVNSSSPLPIDSSRACCAYLFPVVPACPCIQHSVTFPFRLSMSCLIFLVFGFFVWLFPDAAIMVLSQSVNITPLILWIAPMRASCSLFRTEY